MFSPAIPRCRLEKRKNLWTALICYACSRDSRRVALFKEENDIC